MASGVLNVSKYVIIDTFTHVEAHLFDCKLALYIVQMVRKPQFRFVSNDSFWRMEIDSTDYNTNNSNVIIMNHYKVFNYPYDTSKTHPIGPAANPSDDEPAFIHIGKNFTSTHPQMATETCQIGDQEELFEYGITNGAAWYSIQGTLQDYGYIGKGYYNAL